ncbi:MAG: putative lipid II flippase FtsW [Candidatus Aminicenantaceae bacterium]
MEIYRPYGFDKTLFLTTVTLIAIGIIMIFSTSAILSSEKYQQPFHFFINQLTVAVLGIVMILIILTIRKPFYQLPLFVYGLLALSFVLLVICLVIPSVGNTTRWIQFFGLHFQPSELAKISLVLFFSLYLDRKKDKLDNFQTLIFPLVILSLFVLLILKEPDYGTAILIFLISTVMFFVGGVKLKHLLYLGITSVSFFAFFLFQASYRWERILGFLYPDRDPLKKGFQIIQSKLAIGSGGFIGVSIGESTQKLYFLPCAHTDYIFAIIGEELGLIGASAILMLLLIFLIRGTFISLRAPNNFSKIAAAGLTMVIVSQALLNISIVLGLGPPTGIPLPLISYGRSSLICTLFAIGILLNISQRKRTSKRKR